MTASSATSPPCWGTARAQKRQPRSSPNWTSIYALGWRGSVFFVDDNFIGNKKQLKREILPALIEWRQGKRGLPFSTEVSINLADDEELMSMMVDAGFTTVFVGIETPDEDSLAECNKFQNRGRDLVESVQAHPARRDAGAGRVHRRL